MKFFKVISFSSKDNVVEVEESEHPFQFINPLSNPEDFISAVEESRKSGNHGNIHSILKNRNINLGKEYYNVYYANELHIYSKHV